MGFDKEKYKAKASKFKSKSLKHCRDLIGNLKRVSKFLFLKINNFKENQLKDIFFLTVDKTKEGFIGFINYALIITLTLISFNIYDYNYITTATRVSLLILILLNFYTYFRMYLSYGIKTKGIIPVIKRRLIKNKVKLSFIVFINALIIVALIIKGWTPFAIAWAFTTIVKISEKKY